jgi:hypothetical protein
LLLLQVVTVFTPSPNIDTLSLNFWHQDLVKLRWKGRKSEKKRFHWVRAVLLKCERVLDSCWILLSRSGLGPESLHFSQARRCCWFCRSMDNISRSKNWRISWFPRGYMPLPL